MSYALPNAWELAERRLELLEASHDADSIRFAEALGIGPDWDCLEAGAGHGSFARWLAGRARSVLAVDLDVRLLQHLEAPNLEVRSLNLATEALPPAAFDLVHTRLVLIHVPERERRCATSSAPCARAGSCSSRRTTRIRSRRPRPAPTGERGTRSWR